jgi:UDPglucose 6-dehydrogenase
VKVTIIGSGYVGLVTGACLAETGNSVVCFDSDEAKICRLRDGDIPIYEPGLREIVISRMAAGKLRFTPDVSEATAHGKFQFIAVGTPPNEDGSADLKHVLSAARAVGRNMVEPKTIVNKSTVPVGTADRVREVVAAELQERGLELSFSVVSNPEFLKEGAAIKDFMRPDRIVIGSDDPAAKDAIRDLYSPFVRSHDRILMMDTRSAELTKYAANAMLATRISFMNELSRLALVVGADIESVREGIGTDSRIGLAFLYPGCGYGGSCFPKDVKALLKTASDHSVPLRVVGAAEEANSVQKRFLVTQVLRRFQDNLSGRRFAVWGLAFKPDTDDMREAPSRDVIAALLQAGAEVCTYDPVALEAAKLDLGNQRGLFFASSAERACVGADALLIITEWKEFRSPDFEQIRRVMKSPIVFDGRNLYRRGRMHSEGFEYFSIGRQPVTQEVR